MAKIRKNDTVMVIAGKDKGRTGRVLRVLVDKNRVLVEGVGMIKKHVKPNPQRNTAGGIVQQEAAIHLSNVMLLDSAGKVTRVGSRVEGERRVRVARSNGEAIAAPQATR